MWNFSYSNNWFIPKWAEIRKGFWEWEFWCLCGGRAIYESEGQLQYELCRSEKKASVDNKERELWMMALLQPWLTNISGVTDSRHPQFVIYHSNALNFVFVMEYAYTQREMYLIYQFTYVYLKCFPRHNKSFLDIIMCA